MDKSCQLMLMCLDDELTRKCYELQSVKQERTLKRCFALLSTLFVIVPVLLVFYGVSFIAFVLPALIFLCVGAFLLSPVLFIRKGAVLQ